MIFTAEELAQGCRADWWQVERLERCAQTRGPSKPATGFSPSVAIGSMHMILLSKPSRLEPQA